jgi:4-phytase/acid phosphatase
MDQLRELQPLTAGNPPAYAYFPIPGCGVKGEPRCARWRPSRRSSAASWPDPAKN